MKSLHRGDHRRTRSRLWPLAAPAALDNAAARVSTHLKEARVGLPGRPILVRRALLRFDRFSVLFRSDDGDDHHQVTPLTPDTGPAIPLRTVHCITSRNRRDRFM